MTRASDFQFKHQLTLDKKSGFAFWFSHCFKKFSMSYHILYSGIISHILDQYPIIDYFILDRNCWLKLSRQYMSLCLSVSNEYFIKRKSLYAVKRHWLHQLPFILAWSLRNVTKKTWGPLCVCTTHMQFKDPPSALLNRVVDLSDFDVSQMQRNFNHCCFSTAQLVLSFRSICWLTCIKCWWKVQTQQLTVYTTPSSRKQTFPRFCFHVDVLSMKLYLKQEIA